MTKYITILILLFLTLNCNAQISIDSLFSCINASFIKVGSRDYMEAKFTIFETADKKERYDLYLDSTNQLNEYIGLSVVHYVYDDQHRIKLIEGFNRNGARGYWDFPEVQKFRYVNDTLVPEINKIRNQICNCDNPDTLSNVIILQEMNADPSNNLTRYAVFSKDSLMKLTFSFATNGALSNNSMNVAYTLREETNLPNKSLIIYERYYNSKLKLVMGEHNVNISERATSITYAYAVRQFDKGFLKTSSFYNKRGKLIKTMEY